MGAGTASVVGSDGFRAGGETPPPGGEGRERGRAAARSPLDSGSRSGAAPFVPADQTDFFADSPFACSGFESTRKLGRDPADAPRPHVRRALSTAPRSW